MRLLIFLVAAVAAGQTWEQKLAASRAALEKALQSEAPPAQIEQTLIELAHIEQAEGSYEAAHARVGKALALRRARLDRLSPELAPLFLETAISFRLQGLSNEGIGQAIAAHQILNLAHGSQHESLVEPLELMGMLYADLQSFEAAARSYEEALALLDQPGASEDKALRLLDTLGDLYRNLNMYDVSETKYRRSLSIRERRLGRFDAELIPTVDGLAYVLFGLKRYRDAEPFYERLLALWRKHGGPEHPMTALTIEKTAEFWALQEQYERADCMLEQAVEIREKTLAATLRQKARIQRALP